MSSLPSNVSDSASPAAASSGKSAPLTTGHGAEQVATGIWLLHGQGQSFVAETSVGLVVVDAGPGGEVTASMIDALRQCSEAPVHALCYSHGHVGYNAGVPQWLEHAHLRGEPAPRLIAHQNVPRRYARYRETSALQQHLNGMQFRMAPGDFEVRLCDPQELFERHLVIGEGDRRVELLWAPSETDCSIAVWCPVQRVLYGGPAVIDSIPNVGTPLRTQRDPVRWADSLEDLMRLRPEKVVREFGATISGADAVQHVLGTTVRALRWLRAETVRLMNEGLDERELLARIAYPEDLFGATWMRPTYGDPSYIVRDIYRSENGWWDRNPTSLHPAAPSEVARALAEAISDKATVLNHARQLAERGQLQLALHVIDLLAQAEGEAPEISEARRLKARWLRERARQVKSYVSKSLFHHGASQLESGADVAVPAPT
jgi:alkyl sulfatase BDS1-like metallo-beta-lactamase superfamily hydrolase